ncbi:558_t:CDS:2 [Dentiscutata erythropus]|uniref:558_t:CDS:1 n=1 Tax=Dentiscutata erythropus TaxID=1348616 RepID=A0A9N9GD05_9GLOM|nr:558_t:CDS:2 [Dentiscutata erythropus]
MSKQSKQSTKRSARLLQRTNKPELESLAYNEPQEHQLSLLPQPLVSIGLSEPSKVQKDMTPSTQESNVDTNSLLSGLKKIRRSKSAKSLFAQNNKRVRGYNKNKVLNLLLNTEVHSPEVSETDKDSQEKKRKIIVYNYAWRSLEVLGLRSSQSRPQNYDDSRFFYLVSRPKDIPRWAYITSESENEKVSETSMKRRRVTNYNRSIMYSRNSELETGESSTIDMIRGALSNNSDNEDDDINEEDINEEDINDS